MAEGIVTSDISRALEESFKDAMKDPAPEGFSVQKMDNFKRFKSMWPKEFPPIEANTPMWWLIDLLSTMITEMQMEPLKHIGDRVSDVVAKELHSKTIKDEINYYIQEQVKTQLEEFFKYNQDKESKMRAGFLSDLEKL